MWRPSLEAVETEQGVAVVLSAEKAWAGKLVFDIPRHRHYMGFKHDWPRMNTMPEWFTVELDQNYVVRNVAADTQGVYSGKQLHAGVAVALKPGESLQLLITVR